MFDALRPLREALHGRVSRVQRCAATAADDVVHAILEVALVVVVVTAEDRADAVFLKQGNHGLGQPVLILTLLDGRERRVVHADKAEGSFLAVGQILLHPTKLLKPERYSGLGIRATLMMSVLSTTKCAPPQSNE